MKSITKWASLLIIIMMLGTSCKKDKTAPSISILSNVYDMTQAMKGDTIIFQITAEDKAGVKELRLLEDGVLLHSSQSSSLSYNWYTAEVDSGRHHFSIIAIDEEDNQSEDKLWVYVNEISFARVEGGTFIMGSNNGEDDEGPEHSVTLDGFEIMKTEVTIGQYACFLNAINCPLDGWVDGERYFYDNHIGYYIDARKHPYRVHGGIENYSIPTITWQGAQAYAQWLGGRLASEAEWEFACRGGNQSQNYLYSGSNDINEVALVDINNGYFVATKLPNELGIYDMSGGLMEWCYDYYDENYYSNSPEDNPMGPVAPPDPEYNFKVRRGNTIEENIDGCTYYNREQEIMKYSIVTQAIHTGFRIIKPL